MVSKLAEANRQVVSADAARNDLAEECAILRKANDEARATNASASDAAEAESARQRSVARLLLAPAKLSALTASRLPALREAITQAETTAAANGVRVTELTGKSRHAGYFEDVRRLADHTCV